jgi:hypothetical protein
MDAYGCRTSIRELKMDIVASRSPAQLWIVLQQQHTPSALKMRTMNQHASLALSLIDYLHPPVIGIFYLGSLLCSHYAFHGAAPLGIRRQYVTRRLLLLLNFSYLAEASYYAYLLLSDTKTVPGHVMVHVLGTMLVWMAITIALFATSSPLRALYAGTFGIECLIQAVFCVVNGLLLPSENFLGILRLSLSVVRTTAALGLLAAAGQTEDHNDEETASLLGTAHKETGCMAYFKQYSVFVPYLWPKEVTAWFAARIAIVILNRFTNFAIPQQEGVLLDQVATPKKLSKKHIAWWIVLQLLSLGCKHSDDWASTRIQASSYQKLTNMALSHTLSLSWNLLLNENTGELVKAGDQAQSLNNLIELVCFEICPMLFDLVLATSYMGYTFGIYIVFIVLALSLAYGWLGVIFTTWINSSRREWMEHSRTRYQISTECISLHSTISYFNRAEFELDRY